MLQNGFSMLECVYVAMVLDMVASSIYIYYLESSELYFDLCMQYSTETLSCIDTAVE